MHPNLKSMDECCSLFQKTLNDKMENPERTTLKSKLSFSCSRILHRPSIRKKIFLSWKDTSDKLNNMTKIYMQAHHHLKLYSRWPTHFILNKNELRGNRNYKDKLPFSVQQPSLFSVWTQHIFFLIFHLEKAIILSPSFLTLTMDKVRKIVFFFFFFFINGELLFCFLLVCLKYTSLLTWW
jgi:hypothetical protein